MVLILLSWLFTLCCLVPVGVLVLDRLPGRVAGAAILPVHAVFTGLIAVVVAATLWSFTGPIGAAFTGSLLTFALLVLAVQRQRFLRLFAELVRRWRGSHVAVRLAFVLLVLIALVKSASPSELLDANGYYLPYIRWIEHFRVVPGIGNIEDRLGFNSAFHMGSAAFGLAWILPGGLYALNGLLLVVAGAWFLGGANELLRQAPLSASRVMKVCCLFFLMRNVLTAPAADLANMLYGELVLILLMERIEQGRMAKADQDLYLVFAYALMVTTVKFSSVLLLLGPAYCVVRLFQQRVRMNVAALLVLPVVILAPWMARSYVLSGYPIYPLPAADLFTPDWKVPTETMLRQYHYVGEFAKTNAKPGESGALAHRPIADWAPVWFKRENAFNKAMAVAVILGTVGLLALAVVRRARAWEVDRIAYVLFLWLLLATWFVLSPAFRFGWAWIIVFVAFACHALCGGVAQGRAVRAGVLALCALFLLQGAVKSFREDRHGLAHQLFRPAPWQDPETFPQPWNGTVVRVAVGEFCGGALPPCFPRSAVGRVVPRGPKVTDGFRPRGSRTGA